MPNGENRMPNEFSAENQTPNEFVA